VEQAENKGIGYIYDHDAEYLYTNSWEWVEEDRTENQLTYRYPYTWVNGVLIIDKDNKERVLRDTTYKVDQSPIEKKLNLLERLVKSLLPHLQY